MGRVFYKVALVLIFAAAAFGQSEKLAYGPEFQTEKNGYRLAKVGVDLSDCKTCFEGIAHYTDLYDGKKRLGRVGTYSISPTGKFAIWEDHSGEVRQGRLLLYMRNSGEIHDIRITPFAIPRCYVWREPKNELSLTFYPSKENKEPKDAVISLETGLKK